MIKEAIIYKSNAYLFGLKLHYSTFLMQNEGLKLKDGASLAGFANEHEFYRSFHSHLGMTPLDYRRLHAFAGFQEVLLKMRKGTGQ